MSYELLCLGGGQLDDCRTGVSNCHATAFCTKDSPHVGLIQVGRGGGGTASRGCKLNYARAGND